MGSEINFDIKAIDGSGRRPRVLRSRINKDPDLIKKAERQKKLQNYQFVKEIYLELQTCLDD